MALQEVLEFIYWFMLLQSEDLPAHTEVFMTIFLHNKVQNQDIYPDPEHRNASLGNVAVVYRAPWRNCTSELHLPEIHGTAWNLGWGGKASDEGLILFHCPSLLKWKLHAPAQFEHRGLADDRSKSPSKHNLSVKSSKLWEWEEQLPDTSAKECFLQSYKICFFCKEQIYVCPDRHGSSPLEMCSPFLRGTSSSTTDKQAQLLWSLGLDSAALVGRKAFRQFSHP